MATKHHAIMSEHTALALPASTEGDPELSSQWPLQWVRLPPPGSNSLALAAAHCSIQSRSHLHLSSPQSQCEQRGGTRGERKSSRQRLKTASDGAIDSSALVRPTVRGGACVVDSEPLRCELWDRSHSRAWLAPRLVPLCLLCLAGQSPWPPPLALRCRHRTTTTMRSIHMISTTTRIRRCRCRAARRRRRATGLASPPSDALMCSSPRPWLWCTRWSSSRPRHSKSTRPSRHRQRRRTRMHWLRPPQQPPQRLESHRQASNCRCAQRTPAAALARRRSQLMRLRRRRATSLSLRLRGIERPSSTRQPCCNERRRRQIQ